MADTSTLISRSVTTISRFISTRSVMFLISTAGLCLLALCGIPPLMVSGRDLLIADHLDGISTIFLLALTAGTCLTAALTITTLRRVGDGFGLLVFMSVSTWLAVLGLGLITIIVMAGRNYTVIETADDSNHPDVVMQEQSVSSTPCSAKRSNETGSS